MTDLRDRRSLLILVIILFLVVLAGWIVTVAYLTSIVPAKEKYFPDKATPTCRQCKDDCRSNFLKHYVCVGICYANKSCSATGHPGTGELSGKNSLAGSGQT